MLILQVAMMVFDVLVPNQGRVPIPNGFFSLIFVLYEYGLCLHGYLPMTFSYHHPFLLQTGLSFQVLWNR